MQDTLINYLRKEDGTPRGTVVAVRHNDEIHYGFSLRNPIDKWDRKLGVKKAVARAMAGEYKLPKVGERRLEIIHGYQKLQIRALRYFKELKSEDIVMNYEEETI
jgi:hypothetical protein